MVHEPSVYCTRKKIQLSPKKNRGKRSTRFPNYTEENSTLTQKKSSTLKKSWEAQHALPKLHGRKFNSHPKKIVGSAACSIMAEIG